MANDKKPLAGAIEAAQIIDDHCGCMVITDSTGTYRQTCASCREAADIIARESGLERLVEAVESLSESVIPGEEGPVVLNAMRVCFAIAREIREGK